MLTLVDARFEREGDLNAECTRGADLARDARPSVAVNARAAIE
jgi:hypothetical protein